MLFDTTFLVDADRAGDSLDEVVSDDDDVAIAAITVAELRVGVLLSTGRHRSVRLAFLDEVIETIPVLDYDRTVADAHAELMMHVRRRGTPRGAHELIIAATARAADRHVVSADEAAYADLPGLQIRSHRQR